LVSDFGTLKSMMVRDSEGKLVFGEKRAFDALDIVLPKIADTLAALPEEDVNAVIHPCLGVVMRQHEKGWVKIFDQGALMFDDIDLFTMLQLVARVVADSLGNFLKEPPGSGTPTQP
ncbi:phage tail assembly chaperone, partial [Escherichia coli]|uniref:phage tail assembly chaperone n=2 Tax=Enterobacteriaceae TaxID=543 RepID=UPI003D20AE1D